MSGVMLGALLLWPQSGRAVLQKETVDALVQNGQKMPCCVMAAMEEGGNEIASTIAGQTDNRIETVNVALVDEKEKTDQAVLTFERTSYDFGKIGEKDGVVSVEFGFVNEGTLPLVITRAETSCTCTKVSFSKKPVPPGKKGTITVTYDPKKQSGKFYKAIQIFSNGADKRLIVTIRGEVVAAKE